VGAVSHVLVAGIGVSTAGSRPIAMLVVLGGFAIVPFVVLMLTSFVKVSVVLSILRSAIGTGQIPSSQIVTGLSMLLTVFIMAPIGEAIVAAVQPVWDRGSDVDLSTPGGLVIVAEAASAAKGPMQGFLQKHARKSDVETFFKLAQQLRSGNALALVRRDDVLVLGPSFVVSELRRAFEMGFLIFVPFLILDLIVGSIIGGLGLQSLSPSVVALPLKILLFVLADGWSLILRGVVGSYV
jgi:type III secretion protein R